MVGRLWEIASSWYRHCSGKANVIIYSSEKETAQFLKPANNIHGIPEQQGVTQETSKSPATPHFHLVAAAKGGKVIKRHFVAKIAELQLTRAEHTRICNL